MNRIVFYLMLMFLLFGCGNKSTKFEAWNNTYWGMNKKQLEKSLQKTLLKEEKCESKNTISCSIIILENYAIGNYKYDIFFEFNDEKLSSVNLLLKKDTVNFAENNTSSKESIIQELTKFSFELNQSQKAGKVATLELLTLLSEKYGEPIKSKKSDGFIQYFWDKDFTNIELNSYDGLLVIVNYKPNKSAIYLNSLPSDHDKL